MNTTWRHAVTAWLNSEPRPVKPVPRRPHPARKTEPKLTWPELNGTPPARTMPNPRSFEDRLAALEEDVRDLKEGIRLLLSHITAKPSTDDITSQPTNRPVPAGPFLSQKSFKVE